MKKPSPKPFSATKIVNIIINYGVVSINNRIQLPVHAFVKSEELTIFASSEIGVRNRKLGT
jgi:hypothetical protein